MQLRQCFIVLLFVVSPKPLMAYGYLAEFVSGSSVRAEGDPIASSDEIKLPLWIAGDTNQIALGLCTNLGYATADIQWLTNRRDELLADSNAAARAWADVDGADLSALDFATVVEATNCHLLNDGNPATLPTPANTIYFQNLGITGPIAFTSVTYAEDLVSGQLVIEQSNIVFNSHSSFDYATGPCFATPASCSTASSVLSYRGILTHELGHFLGLAHSMIRDHISGTPTTVVAHEGQATMFPAVSNKWDSQAVESLHTDDELSLLNLYYVSTTLPAGKEGILEGNIVQADGKAFRGAHLLVFNTTTQEMIAGAFSGITGIAGTRDGSFRLRGLPTNTDFILIAEPVDQPDQDFLNYSHFSVPISYALEDDFQGYAQFEREAYPDQPLTAFRSDPDISIGSAEVFNLSSGSPTRSGLNFYVSQTIAAPNDNKLTSLDLALEGNNLRLRLQNPAGLHLASLTSSLSVVATRNSQNSDWSSSFESFSLLGTSSTQTKALTDLVRVAGTYTITASLTDANAGVLSDTLTVIAGAELVGDTSPSSGGGGGCSLSAQRKMEWPMTFLLTPLVLLITVINIRKRVFKTP